MTFNSVQYKTSTRQQWQDYASGWNDWAPLLESWLGEATERMLDLAGVEAGSNVLDVAAGAGEQADVWNEIEAALSEYDTANGFVGPCELVIAGATR